MFNGSEPDELMSSTPQRLAFTFISRRAWAGGYNYLANLFASLDAHQKGRFTPVVFAETDADHQELAELTRLRSVEVVRSDAFDRTRGGLAAAVLTGLDRAAVDEFRRHRIDIVVETARFFGWRLPYPSVAWFPDLQHRRLPHLFSFPARSRRELGLRMQIASGRVIMLSSEDARRDCDRFYPSLRNRTRVVRFASYPPAELLSVDPMQVAEEYSLPGCFFYLPNQFWKHKNHQVVIDALEILKRRGLDIVVAASGSNQNSQDSNYFANMMMQIEQRGIQANFRYLGMIPYAHVYALLRSSAALINPSSFEGWSTTVEEAKSFGTPMILSDISVHREQAAGGARYFGLDDPSALANHLAAVAAAFEPSKPRMPLPDVDKRVAAFAVDFADTIDFVRSRYVAE
jgi:glycosyltransferase involved in cell wall biosynthesis